MRSEEKTVHICLTFTFILWRGIHSCSQCSRLCIIHDEKTLYLLSRAHQQGCSTPAVINYWEGVNSNQKQILQVLSLDKTNGEKYSNFSTTFVQFQCRYLVLGLTKATLVFLVVLFKSLSKTVLSKQAPFSAEIISNSTEKVLLCGNKGPS